MSDVLQPVTVRFFFFQAEDGIRDLTVTGVQTCALPISPSASAFRNPCVDYVAGFNVLSIVIELPTASLVAGGNPKIGIDRKSVRVGKECRSRWSPYH